MSRVGTWTVVCVVEDLLQTLGDKIEHLRDFGIHAFRDYLGVVRQVVEDILLLQRAESQGKQPLKAFPDSRLGDVVRG